MTAPDRTIATARISGAAATAVAIAVVMMGGACTTTAPASSATPSSPADPTTAATTTPDVRPTATSSQPTATTSPDDDSPTPRRPKKTTSTNPTKGWQTVRYGQLRYDVPPDWEVRTVRTGGQKVPRPTYKRGFCKAEPQTSLGMVLLTSNPKLSSPKKAVRAELRRAAKTFYSDRSPHVKVLQIKHKGRSANAAGSVTLAPSKSPCDGGSAVVAISGWTTKKSTGVNLLMAIGELGLADSPDPGNIVRIINSARSAG